MFKTNVSIFIFIVFLIGKLWAQEIEGFPFMTVPEYLNKYHQTPDQAIAQYQAISCSLEGIELPVWMLENIQQELSVFDPFVPDELDELFYISSLTLLHFRIQNGILFVRCNHSSLPPPTTEIPIVLSKILSLPGLSIKEGDFLLCVEDGVGKQKSKLPVWCYSKHRESNYVCVPDWFAVGLDKDSVMKETDEATNLISRHKRKNLAFWIGMPNGKGFNNKMTWQENNRSQLVLYSLCHPDILWARFADFHHLGNICEDMRSTAGILCSPRKSILDACQYKYLIDVDGYASAFHRYQWILRSQSVPIKEDSGNVQWFYPGLKAYEHFVPYQTDCSDLQEKIEWLRAHDNKALQIAQAGRKFAKTHLDINTTYLYFYHVMKEMNKLNLTIEN